jgi:carbon-monoxide dehydrogenase small subunit
MNSANTSTLVNGRSVTIIGDGATTLLDFLRDSLGLRGTKEGCNEGECGACTVLIDGRPVDSCLYPALAAEGRIIETIEGMDEGSHLSSIQAALVATGGIQCGFCTPGFVMTLTALLRKQPNPNRNEIVSALAGNLCRCTGYSQIVEAAVSLSELGKES